MSGETSGRRGELADTPVQIPPGGWWQVIRRAMSESTADNVPMLAGGVAYFGFLALFPAVIAAISLYGLIADAGTVTAQLNELAAILPRSAQPLVAEQLAAVLSTGSGQLGLGLALSVLAALWSASGGTTNLIKAINVAYDEDEKRGAIKLRALALVMTVGAILFVLVTLALVAVTPIALDALHLGAFGRVTAQLIRWAALLGLVIAALAVVYRLAPDRDAPRFRWVSAGAVVAAGLWLVGSAGFSLYVNYFGNYNKTYGTLGGVVVLMLWLYLTSYIVLLGAEINAESERQTRRDTTTGPPRRMGERDAYAADTVAGGPGPEPDPANPAPAPRDIPPSGYVRGMSAHSTHHEDRTHDTGPADRLDVQSVSTGELVSRLSSQVSDLVRAEVALARSELQAKGSRLGKGAGLTAGAGALGAGGLLTLIAAAVAALALVVPVWAAALIVGVALLVVGGLIALVGRQQIRKAMPPLPEQAAQNAQRDVNVIKEGLKHRSC